MSAIPRETRQEDYARAIALEKLTVEAWRIGPTSAFGTASPIEFPPNAKPLSESAIRPAPEQSRVPPHS